MQNSMIKSVTVSLILCVLLLLPTTPSLASMGKIAIITRADSGIHEITRDQLSLIFKNQLARLNGRELKPVNLSASHPLRLRFIELVHRTTAFQMKQHWLSVRIKGQGQPPKSYGSEETIQTVVEKAPGAVGYVEYTPALEGRFTCLRIDGRSCQDADYPLNYDPAKPPAAE